MNDLIEVQYQIGELRSWIATFDERIPAYYEKRDDQKKHVKELQSDLNEAKKELADIQTKIAEYEEIKARYEEFISELETLSQQILTEAEAVQVLRVARDNGKFDRETQRYISEFKPDADRFKKAMFTIVGTAYKVDPQDIDGLWTVRVEGIPESYREFLYGIEEATE